MTNRPERGSLAVSAKVSDNLERKPEKTSENISKKERDFINSIMTNKFGKGFSDKKSDGPDNKENKEEK
jgi:hypothetical protein